ncbi:60S ribosomal protein L29 [Pneumocystis carinii B80]|uniref:60S ribosomal protein L29 n=1 Tax=Pneumocystis carinii (strain B80) TaxID=1408658 RepID=A0A0W4ZH06_PNEC8|nr:60S ribosomal protein L29 [Pneumocystis carinii B80]KTW27643.1 60S ribosomal protein L29 [Pneumocystis carinii B80]
MAKSKNHTNHNQTRKAHRNGIRRPKTGRFLSLKYVDPKFALNRKYAIRGTFKALKENRTKCL